MAVSTTISNGTVSRKVNENIVHSVNKIVMETERNKYDSIFTEQEEWYTNFTVISHSDFTLRGANVESEAQTVTRMFLTDDAKIVIKVDGREYELTASLLNQVKEIMSKDKQEEEVLV
tara:strand:+ start:315 stop:668 length:354 start_codon:yes stop_codon:yes gene_type:complete